MEGWGKVGAMAPIHTMVNGEKAVDDAVFVNDVDAVKGETSLAWVSVPPRVTFTDKVEEIPRVLYRTELDERTIAHLEAEMENRMNEEMLENDEKDLYAGIGLMFAITVICLTIVQLFIWYMENVI